MCFFFSGIAVGLFPAISAEDLSKICIDCKADIIVVENEKLLKRVLLVQHKLPQLKAIIQLEGEPPLSDKRRLYKSHKVRNQIKSGGKFLIFIQPCLPLLIETIRLLASS